MSFFTERIKVIRGSKKLINVFFIFDDTGRPFPLTGFTEIKFAFSKQVTGVLTKTYTNSGGVTVVGVPELGQVQVSLAEADTLLLKICKEESGRGSDFTGQVTFPDGVQYFNFQNILFVEDPSAVPA